VCAGPAGDASAVEWTRPDDLSFDDEKLREKLFGLHDRGFNALFADGHVERIAPSVDGPFIKAMLTRNGGDRFGGEDFKDK
jgi:prepilin-type processing-associated H-X9-DG protein